MSDPRFLTTQQVTTIHSHQVNTYGGSHGLRDEGLLESAVAAPAATFGGQFLHSDIFEMAAAYLYGICQNHAFVDGNKRTAAVTAMFFLHQNGVEVEPRPEEYERLVLGVAKGHVEKADVAAFLRRVPDSSRDTDGKDSAPDQTRSDD